MRFDIIWAPVFILLFILVHLLKMIRLYLVLMEQKIPFKRFMYLYFETTCFNLIIPFKLGEIYRVLRLSACLKSFEIGFYSTLTDRFFDTASLLVILFLISIAGNTSISYVMLFLLGFILVVAFTYLIFPQTYRYLNRYIIMNKSSKRSMGALRVLDRCNDSYCYLKQLIRGRSALLIICSLLGWIAEGFALWALAKIIGVIFGMAEFGAYISSIFSYQGGELLRAYSLFGIAALGILVIIFAIGKS